MRLFFVLLLIIMLFFNFNSFAQESKDTLQIATENKILAKNISYEKGKEYILGGISVTGLKKFSEETVKIFTGLVIGTSMKLPGVKLTNAIKKLYESKQFSNIDVYLSKIKGNTIYLEFFVEELPQLNLVKIKGLRKSKAKELIEEANLKTGVMVTDNLIVTSKNYFIKKYVDKGFLKTKVNLDIKKDTSDTNSVNMYVFIDKGKRIKIKDIKFTGNKAFSTGKLLRTMKKTKKKVFGRFWKRSKYVIEDYNEDLENILDRYSRLGYRDIRILSDKITWNSDNTININIELEEGKQYRFGDILFVGNKEFTDERLKNFLKIEKGDIYNGVVLKERVKGDNTPDSQDISTLYQNSGFLFSSINAVETKINNDSITVEIRIREDEKARIKKVIVSGNNNTNDHVLFREIRVKPGSIYSKSAIIRSIREIGQLGFFDTNVVPDLIPDFQNKTTDIKFTVIEKGSSQIQLQGGYGGNAFVGTLGLSFNNFSTRNIFKKESYKPIPMGDGQTLAINLQASRANSTYSFSFTEPWLGGKKPNSLSFSIYTSNQYQFNTSTGDVDKSKSLKIIGATVGLGKRLKWPDDYFQLSQSISYQALKSKDYAFGLAGLSLNNGTLNNLAYNLTLSRNSAGPSLVFPTYGSEFQIRLKGTFPYSLFNGIDYSDKNLEDVEKYKWLEYYKIGFKGKWYTSFTNKLVLMTNAEVGYLGTYNSELGLTPVERYFVGGDGIATFLLDGREVVGLRGYENSSISSTFGGTIYNKFQLELRYSITDSPSASIYALGFLEGGNSYDNFNEFNPFVLKRSAGAGIRIFMSAFGLLGIDFAHGFDPLPGQTNKSGWQTHFIIGRQF